jgi:phospholipid/cholesterol/gamma-HCH transport system substrate-binding protein
VKKNKMELIVGGTILIAIFILISGVLWLKASMVTSNMAQYTVLFPNVGTLQMSDPVMVNGVKKGSVTGISLKGVGVAVVIDLDKEVVLTDSSRITVQNIGLMGERMVGIQLNRGGKAYKPNEKGTNETVYIQGYFDTGIAEAMGMIGTVLSDVRVLVKNVGGIVDGTVGDSSFAAQFKRIVARLETVTVMAETLIAETRPSLGRSVAAIEKLTEDVKGLLDSNKARITTIASNGSQLSARAVTIADKVDSLTGALASMVDKINNGEGTAGLLLKDERFYYDMKKSIGDLDILVKEIERDGLKLRIKLGFGKKEKIHDTTGSGRQ